MPEETLPIDPAPGEPVSSPSGDLPRRIWGAFIRPTRSHFLVAAVLLVCGLLVTLQVRGTAGDDTYSSLRRADLLQMMDDLDAQSQRLSTEIAQLQAVKQQLATGADKQRTAELEAQSRLASLQVLAGTVAVHGPGVRITIVDPAGKVTPQIILNALEEMRDAGAEVIEFNDSIRVVANTWVTQGPQGLIVDDQSLSLPITMDVIGEPHALDEAARFRGGLISQVQDSRIGGSVTLTTSDKIDVASLYKPKAAQFARPA
ncbi:MAG: DUF881 domain-containing protein [Propionibacteriaceae bacterium]|nr:DUF881 domain-containing protein [Micropruina sp.]